jgi:hypothetical protein
MGPFADGPERHRFEAKTRWCYGGLRPEDGGRTDRRPEHRGARRHNAGRAARAHEMVTLSRGITARRPMIGADLARGDGARRQAGNDGEPRDRHLQGDHIGGKAAYQAPESAPKSHLWKPHWVTALLSCHPDDAISMQLTSDWHDVHRGGWPAGPTESATGITVKAPHRIGDHAPLRPTPAPIDNRAPAGSGFDVLDRQITTRCPLGFRRGTRLRPSISSTPILSPLANPQPCLPHHGPVAAIYCHTCPRGTFH